MALRFKGSRILFIITSFLIFLVLCKQYLFQKGNSVSEDNIKRDYEKVTNLKMAEKPQQGPSLDSGLFDQALSINFAQKMHNVEKYGDHTSDSIILIVQVHDREEYFKEFVNSLQTVRGIEKATLVISMDKFLPANDKIISSITACRYMIIYFPYSMQLFPKSFPGEDPNDCPRDIAKSEAIAKGCNNAEYPDQFGHYREVKYVQIKHHWFWKLHMVYSGIRAFSDNKAPVLLLEEDYFLSPDILYCAKLGLALKQEKCSKCSLLSLGNYDANQNQFNEVDIHTWKSTKSNMGMLITKDFYDKIVACTDQLCDYDDYNWDWSLQYASSKCIPRNLITMQFKMSRIFHLGSCGGMHSTSNCNLKEELSHVKQTIETRKHFPESLNVANEDYAISLSQRPNGGWGDLRDHALCKRYKSLCEILTRA